MVLDASLAVGSRLQIGRDRASIRYVGPIEGQVGDWVGLEWDDPARGKHDGSTGGRQYFTCVHSRTPSYPHRRVPSSDTHLPLRPYTRAAHSDSFVFA